MSCCFLRSLSRLLPELLPALLPELLPELLLVACGMCGLLPFTVGTWSPFHTRLRLVQLSETSAELLVEWTILRGARLCKFSPQLGELLLAAPRPATVRDGVE